MQREAKMTIILGAKGTGKTTLLRQILETSKQKCLVVTPRVNEWTDVPDTDLSTLSSYDYNGIRRHIIRRGYSIPRLPFFKRGILVFDDCKTFIKPLDETIEQMLIDGRHHELDIFYVAHGFTRVPPMFYNYYTEIILFRTEDNPAARKGYLLNYDQVLTAQLRVNQAAKSNKHHFEIIRP